MSRFIKNDPTILNTGNYILKMEEFYISFLPPEAVQTITWESDDVSIGETALVKDGKFFILNGDFRKEYEELVDQGYDACYNFFLSKPELKSSWSN